MVKNVKKYLFPGQVYILSSYREGLSRSLLEAMSCGLIPIVSDIRGSREVILNNKNGFIYNFADKNQLLSKMKKVLFLKSPKYQSLLHANKIMLKEKFVEIPKTLLHETIQLNRSLIKHPFQEEDLEVNCSYNIWEFYQNQLIGVEIPIEEIPSKYLIDRTTETWSSWEDWCQEVIWYGNKKGAYLYKMCPVEKNIPSYRAQSSEVQIAGHH